MRGARVRVTQGTDKQVGGEGLHVARSAGTGRSWKTGLAAAVKGWQGSGERGERSGDAQGTFGDQFGGSAGAIVFFGCFASVWGQARSAAGGGMFLRETYGQDHPKAESNLRNREVHNFLVAAFSSSAKSVARPPHLARRSPRLEAALLAAPPRPLASLRHPKKTKQWERCVLVCGAVGRCARW